MKTKSLLASKTVWVQLIAAASTLYPPVGVWVAANPQVALALLGAVNILVRLITKGSVTLFPADDAGNVGKNGGGLGGSPLMLLLLTCMTVGIFAALPSCATSVAPDGTKTTKPDVESIGLAQSIAMWATAVWQSERAAKREAEKAVDVRGSK